MHCLYLAIKTELMRKSWRLVYMDSDGCAICKLQIRRKRQFSGVWAIAESAWLENAFGVIRICEVWQVYCWSCCWILEGLCCRQGVVNSHIILTVEWQLLDFYRIATCFNICACSYCTAICKVTLISSILIVICFQGKCWRCQNLTLACQ